MKTVSLIGVSFLLAISAFGMTTVVFAINGDGSYSFQGQSIDEGTLKARLMITAMRAPQPTVQVTLHGNGNDAAVQKAVQQFKAEAANAGIANVLVGP